MLSFDFDALASAAWVEALFALWCVACAGPKAYDVMHGWPEMREGFAAKTRLLLSAEA